MECFILCFGDDLDCYYIFGFGFWFMGYVIIDWVDKFSFIENLWDCMFRFILGFIIMEGIK